jgi:hypothetical protein
VLTAAAELGDGFERGGPVDVAAVVRLQADRGGPLYVVLADGTTVAADGRPVPEGAGTRPCSCSAAIRQDPGSR